MWPFMVGLVPAKTESTVLGPRYLGAAWIPKMLIESLLVSGRVLFCWAPMVPEAARL